MIRWNCRGFLSFNNFIMDQRILHGQLLSWDSEQLQWMRWERDIRSIVTEVLRWSHIKPIYIEFRLLHPWLRKLWIGHHENRRLTLALERWVELSDETKLQLDKKMLEWAQAQIPALSVDPVAVRVAHWRDRVNWFLQNHGASPHGSIRLWSSSPLPQT